MIGLDTNVVLRHLTDDDPDQSKIAHRIFEGLTKENPGYISFTTILEVHWVLRKSYRYSRDVVHPVLDDILSASDLVVENADLVRRGLVVAASIGRDLPDVLVTLSGQRAGCEVTVTFDHRAQAIPGMSAAR